MRTTLTIEDDVAAELERLRKSREASFKEVVNEALRLGLNQITARPKRPRQPYRTRSVSLGRCKIGPIDNVADTLAVAEGEPYR